MTELEIGIRDVGSFDVPMLAAMHAESFAGDVAGDVWGEASIGEILAMPGAFGLLAIGPGGGPGAPAAEPAGFLLGQAVAEDCEVLSLGVARAWRRCGIARRLLRAGIARARDLGARRIVLDVAEDNLAAQDLYRLEGFSAIARRPRYYRRGGDRISALVLARDVTVKPSG